MDSKTEVTIIPIEFFFRKSTDFPTDFGLSAAPGCLRKVVDSVMKFSPRETRKKSDNNRNDVNLLLLSGPRKEADLKGGVEVRQGVWGRSPQKLEHF